MNRRRVIHSTLAAMLATTLSTAFATRRRR